MAYLTKEKLTKYIKSFRCYYWFRDKNKFPLIAGPFLLFIMYSFFWYFGDLFFKNLYIYLKNNVSLRAATDVESMIDVVKAITILSLTFFFLDFNKKHRLNYLFLLIPLIIHILLPNVFINYLITGTLVFLIIPAVCSTWKSPDWSLIFMLATMLSMLVIGTAFIEELYGEDPVIRNLGISDTGINVSFACTTVGGKEVANHMMYCTFPNTITNISGRIGILYANGTMLNKSFGGEDRKSFLASEFIERVTFQLEGFHNGEKLVFSGKYDPHYLTQEKIDINQYRYVTSFLGLLFIVFFTVPKLFKELGFTIKAPDRQDKK